MELKDYIYRIWHKLRFSLLLPFFILPYKRIREIPAFYRLVSIKITSIVKGLEFYQVVAIIMLILVVFLLLTGSCQLYSINEDGNQVLLGRIFVCQKGGSAKLYGWKIDLPKRLLSHGVTNRYMLHFPSNCMRKYRKENIQIVTDEGMQFLPIQQGMKFYVEKKVQNPYNRYN